VLFFVLFRERLSMQQKLGAALLILGVTGLALVYSR
jgi:drug/metabolite transporter (DMT)-like permease